jgi:hypothetical protein
MRDERDTLERLRTYWSARRGARRYPARADIDPLDFKFALGRVSLVECRPEPPHFRFRLVSTGLTNALGYEMTGRFSDQIPEPQMRTYVEALYWRALAAAAPLEEAGVELLDGRLWHYRCLLLPFSDDGTSINLLLAYREARVARDMATSPQPGAPP